MKPCVEGASRIWGTCTVPSATSDQAVGKITDRVAFRWQHRRRASPPPPPPTWTEAGGRGRECPRIYAPTWRFPTKQRSCRTKRSSPTHPVPAGVNCQRGRALLDWGVVRPRPPSLAWGYKSGPRLGSRRVQQRQLCAWCRLFTPGCVSRRVATVVAWAGRCGVYLGRCGSPRWDGGKRPVGYLLDSPPSAHQLRAFTLPSPCSLPRSAATPPEYSPPCARWQGTRASGAGPLFRRGHRGRAHHVRAFFSPQSLGAPGVVPVHVV